MRRGSARPAARGGRGRASAGPVRDRAAGSRWRSAARAGARRPCGAGSASSAVCSNGIRPWSRSVSRCMGTVEPESGAERVGAQQERAQGLQRAVAVGGQDPVDAAAQPAPRTHPHPPARRRRARGGGGGGCGSARWRAGRSRDSGAARGRDTSGSVRRGRAAGPVLAQLVQGPRRRPTPSLQGRQVPRPGAGWSTADDTGRAAGGRGGVHRRGVISARRGVRALTSGGTLPALVPVARSGAVSAAVSTTGSIKSVGVRPRMSHSATRVGRLSRSGVPVTSR